MRKVRTILITVIILALLAVGGSFAARRAASSSSGKIVEVTAVENVNDYTGYSSYGESMEGTIISKDTQSVYRNAGYALKKVYVSEGDKVKKGDKLLEYDMEKVELEAEKAGLDKWGLELELSSMERELELLKRGIVPGDGVAYRYGEDKNGGSNVTSDDKDDDADADDSDDADLEDEDYLDLTSSEDLFVEAESVQAQAEGIVQEQDDGIVEDAIIDDDEISFVEDDDNGIISEDIDDGLISDPSGSDDSSGGGSSGSGIIDGREEDAEIALIRNVNVFLKTVNSITESAGSNLSVLGSEEIAAQISSALDIYRKQFSEGVSSQQQNLLGEDITVTDYYVKDSVATIIGETSTHILEMAYEMLCAYQFASTMEQLNPGGLSSSAEDADSARGKEDMIREAANLLASLPPGAFTMKNGFSTFSFELNEALNGAWTGDGKESRVEYLKGLVSLFNGATIVEQEQDIPDTVSTEGIFQSEADEPLEYDDGYDDGGEGVDFKELIKEMENSIFEEKLLIREAKLEIKEYDEKLSGRIVYAILDGVVLSSSSSGSGSRNSPIMVITGRKGLYVKGSVKENSLDTVKVGDTVYGSTYSSTSFTAEIVEVSPYPETSNDSYYGFGDENTNESRYPFLAFIENADGLEVDDGVELSLDGEISAFGLSMEEGLALNSSLIRTEENGRSYCLVEGKDGLLEKRYLQLGNNDWGTITVNSGLSRDDYIAFPYGKGVVEGAKTVRVDSLSAMSYDTDYF